MKNVKMNTGTNYEWMSHPVFIQKKKKITQTI